MTGTRSAEDASTHLRTLHTDDRWLTPLHCHPPTSNMSPPRYINRRSFCHGSSPPFPLSPHLLPRLRFRIAFLSPGDSCFRFAFDLYTTSHITTIISCDRFALRPLSSSPLPHYILRHDGRPQRSLCIPSSTVFPRPHFRPSVCCGTYHPNFPLRRGREAPTDAFHKDPDPSTSQSLISPKFRRYSKGIIGRSQDC